MSHRKPYTKDGADPYLLRDSLPPHTRYDDLLKPMLQHQRDIADLEVAERKMTTDLAEVRERLGASRDALKSATQSYQIARWGRV